MGLRRRHTSFGPIRALLPSLKVWQAMQLSCLVSDSPVLASAEASTVSIGGSPAGAAAALEAAGGGASVGQGKASGFADKVRR
jgi:hypothetical protein